MPDPAATATETSPPIHRRIVGVVGGGQLARMTQQAAIALGIDLAFLSDRRSDPAPAVGPRFHAGEAMSEDDLAGFAHTVDLVTFDHEVVDLDVLARLEEAGRTLRPSSGTLRLVADKLGMRSALEDAGLPIPPWTVVRSVDELDAALAEWPDAAVKLSRGGYDGRGVFRVLGAAAGEDIGAALLGRGVPLLVEPWLPLEAELAVLVARRPGGDMVVYDPVETLQVDGQARVITMPARVDASVIETAKALARRAADAVDVAGILALELFDVGGELLINELAARPHNSGHHTIDACVTSQFENHLRAVLDLPLGSPDPVTPAAVTVNVIGAEEEIDPRDRLAEGLAGDQGAHVHLYGKEWRAERKLGHVTVCDEEPDRALDRAWTVVAALGGSEVGR